ncbi:flagellin [Stenotrophomonas maltophilia]|uniref:flagellin n=1 Tax=Stenotrophomonas maltophilia TaxID=40324 RepID=UPI0012B0DCD9|nr:flagellin [Stenotrophomonas maltophilia]MBA0393835.1 flagellin [Stenotrophomonas maltophilia]QGL76166.1 flagellin [Stenotrophomonas maltophilia]
MAQVINTNTMSLNAQRNLSTSGSSLATTIQRLSSGSRINSAKDDAAGLAISERFGTQIRGTDVAIRNANDGISLAQVAEGSLTEIGNNLQRIRELSVQSANATNSSSDRKALQSEVDQLVSEIDRVAKQSEFNGTKLLDGSFSSQLFQVGANAGQAIAIDKITNAQASSIGSSTFAQNGTLTMAAGTALTSGEITGLKIGSVDLGTVKYEQGADATATQANATNATIAAINAKMGETGVYAQQTNDGASPPVFTAGSITLTSVKADLKATDITALTVAGGTGSVTVGTQIQAGTTASTLKDVKITDVAGAQKALEIVDNALQSINSTRADLGAVQNRFTSVVANLQTSTENLSASRSRIKDTDFAKETAELTRTQILQQAGTAMLAQANQVPQGVLSLLR